MLDLAITSDPRLLSISIGIFKLLSDHRSLSIEVLSPSSDAPLPSPASRWNIRMADWGSYHNISQQIFATFQHLDLTTSPNPAEAQFLVDQASSTLTNDIGRCADAAIPRSRPRPPFSFSPQGIMPRD